MTISELIQKLEMLQNRVGDIDVYVFGTGSRDGELIDPWPTSEVGSGIAIIEPMP